MSGLRVSLLGRFTASVGSQELDSFRTSKVQALLIYLLVETVHRPAARLSREQIMTLLWPDTPEKSGRVNLRQALYQLRQMLPKVTGSSGEPAPFILSDRQHIWLNPDARYKLDVASFISLVEEGGRENFTAALDLYRSDFLTNFYLDDSNEYEAWSAGWRSQLRRQVLDVLSWLAAESLEEGEPANAAEYARRELELDDLRESAYRHLMVALGRMGRRSEALRTYEICQRRLEDELGVVPSKDTQAVARAIREEDLALLSNALGEQRERSRLPVPDTPLIGREAEITAITAFFDDGARLVTIVGPGGMGKTRLALEVAHKLTGGAAVFVSLASVADETEMLPALARALKLEFDNANKQGLKQRLLDYLHDKTFLLLLDNFEHLLEEATLLTEILQAAPAVRLLITARERLKLHAEHIFSLRGLPYSDWSTLAGAKQDAAVQLFLHHAQRVRTSFRLQSDDLAAMRTILELTGGLPLALILAAGWVEVLSPSEIIAEIDRNLDFLETTHRGVPQRQQSIRTVFEGTWARLNEREATVFAALSVFRGGFKLAAARAVANAAPRDLLRLADRALLTRLHDDTFEVHELLRQFAAERLVARGLAAEVQKAHSNYYMAALARRLPDLKGRNQLGALDAIEGDFENIRVAWHYAAEYGHHEYIAEACQSLYLFTLIRSRHLEGIPLFEELWSKSDDARAVSQYLYALASWKALLSHAGSHEEALSSAGELQNIVERTSAEPAVVAYCHLALGQVYRANGRLEDAMAALTAAHTYYEEVQDCFYAAETLSRLAMVMGNLGQRTEAMELSRQGLALARQVGDRYAASGLFFGLAAETWLLEGPTEAAEHYYWESARLRRELGDRVYYAYILAQAANIPLWREGDLATPLPALEEALAIAEEQHVSHIHAHVLAELTTHRLVEGDYEDALALSEEVLALAPTESHTWIWASMQHGLAFLALGHTDTALPYMTRGLSGMIDLHWPGFLSTFLPYFGIVLARRGRRERAAELLARGLTHVAAKGRLEADPLIARLQRELESSLAEEHFDAAWERGKSLDALAVAVDVMAELE